MMKNCSLGNPLVDEQVGNVLPNVHGGHIDHDLGIGSMLLCVQYADVSLQYRSDTNPTKLTILKHTLSFIGLPYLIKARRLHSMMLTRIELCLS